MRLMWKLPQMRWHIFNQMAVTWISFIGMMLLFWYLPTIVDFAHDRLYDRGFVPTEFAQQVMSSYYRYGWISLGIAFIGLEIGGYMLVRNYKADPNEYPELQALIKQYAREVWWRPREPTLIVMDTPTRWRERPKSILLNAAATMSFLSGPKIIVMGPIVEMLEPTDMKYVAAHEVKHIAHFDIPRLAVLGVGSGAIGIQKWSLLTSFASSVITMNWRAATYLGVTWIVLSLAHSLYKLLAAAHSRAREYMADAGAVYRVGWEDREHLIIGLSRIAHAMTGWQPIKLFKTQHQEWLHSHPSIYNRAIAIDVDPVELPEGVLLDNTVLRLQHA